MKIVVLGASGMLGSAFFRQWEGRYNVTFLARDPDVFGRDKNQITKWDYYGKSVYGLPRADYYINCVGVIKPFMTNTLNGIRLNSVFPHELAAHCDDIGAKLIHITTDCVFSGKSVVPYVEISTHDAEDTYGKSKSLGEPEGVMVLRTSIVGQELHKNSSLLAWYLQQPPNITVNGYRNHLWNGMTTDEYVRVCEKIITKDMYEPSIFHIFSDTVTKFDLLCLFEQRFKRGVNVVATTAPQSVYRVLSTTKDLNTKLGIRSLREQIMAIQ